jgi:hypothetical protein
MPQQDNVSNALKIPLAIILDVIINFNFEYKDKKNSLFTSEFLISCNCKRLTSGS